MHVYGLGASCIESDHVFFDITNTRDGALKDLLDELPFLRLHYLVIALLELAIDFDVLDVKRSQVLEDLIRGPVGNVLLTLLVLLFRQMLDLNLFLEVVHSICQLHVIGDVAHSSCN